MGRPIYMKEREKDVLVKIWYVEMESIGQITETTCLLHMTFQSEDRLIVCFTDTFSVFWGVIISLRSSSKYITTLFYCILLILFRI